MVSGRYPFMAAANRFLDVHFGVYADGMYDELMRRYPKIQKQLITLFEDGKISTTDPRNLTPDDIKEFVLALRARGLKDVSISHDLSAIKNLCIFVSGNACVDIAKKQYPTLFMKKRYIRLPVLEKPQYNEVIGHINSFSASAPERFIRAAAVVGIAFGAGLRTQEIQHAKIRYLDPNLKFIFLDHVKGSGSYGERRTVPIRPEVAPALKLYLKERNSNSEYLFNNSSGGPFVSQTLRVDKELIADGSGINFDFRMARRTYAQYLIDEGQPIEYVSVVLGHANTTTTERAYGRPRDDRVVRKIIDSWKKGDI